MKRSTSWSIGLLLATGAVVATPTAASADPPPCDGWDQATAGSDAETIEAFGAYCDTGRSPAVYTFKRGFPVKWQGAS